MLTVFLILIFLLSLLIFRKKIVWSEPSPPHPPTHFLLGNVPTLQKQDSIIQIAFDALTNTFGPVLRLKLGREWTLLVSGYDEMKVNKEKYLKLNN